MRKRILLAGAILATLAVNALARNVPSPPGTSRAITPEQRNIDFLKFIVNNNCAET